MKFIDLLKAKWIFWGLDAPAFTWAVAIGLFVITFIVLLRLGIAIYWQKMSYDKARKKVELLKKKANYNASQGLEGSVYEELREVFEKNSPSLTNAWYQLDSQVISTTDENNNNFFWAPESAEFAFNDSIVIDTKINRAFYNSIPGVLTGIGLLTTFLAILVALLDVKLVNTQVQGLELLIQGLSGKFISSIAALLAATIYILIEKPVFYTLIKSRKNLVQSIDKLLPRLTTTKIMAQIKNEMVEQTSAIKGFNSQLAPILRKSFSESMGPTIDRMADAIDDLNQLLRINESQRQESIVEAFGKVEVFVSDIKNEIVEQTSVIKGFNSQLPPMLRKNFIESVKPTIDRMSSSMDELNQILKSIEHQKQESISGTIEKLLENLQKSMANSLEKMSVTFSTALSGTAKDQFNNVATSLRDSTILLESMNTQFNNMQGSLKGLIDFAEASTKTQIAIGKNQVEELTQVLKGLMMQMNENTDKSVSKMNSFIVSTIADMSDKMKSLNKDMVGSIEHSAKKSDEVVNNVIKQAQEISAQNATQIKNLMEKHEELLIKTQGVRQALDISLKNFKETVDECSSIYRNMRDFASQVSLIMTNISNASQSIKSSQEALNQTTTSAKAQVEKIYQINREQEAVWTQIKRLMDTYPTMFKNVENTAKELLTEMANHLESYTKVSSQNFNNLVKVSDEHFANATKRLGASVNELQEYLQDLTEVLEKLRQPSNIRK